jgi:hypothetical protein
MTEAFQKEVPEGMVAYLVLHEAPAQGPTEEYLRVIRELHRGVIADEAAIQSAVQKAAADMISREAGIVYGELTPFLVTPLKSDQAEVRTTIEEGLSRVSTGTRAATFAGLAHTHLVRLLIEIVDEPELTDAQQEGLRYLEQLQFARAGGAVCQSVFVVHGAAGLDRLEHIVRDRLGIYAGAHGTHITQSARWSFAAYNVVLGDPRSAPRDGYEAQWWIDKGRTIQYDVFRRALEGCAHAVQEAVSNTTLVLWQRKLGLGRGREFACCIVCSDITSTVIAAKLWMSEFRKIFPQTEGGETPCLLIGERFPVDEQPGA